MAKRTASARSDGTLSEGAGCYSMAFSLGPEQAKQTGPVSKAAGVAEVNVDAVLED